VNLFQLEKILFGDGCQGVARVVIVAPLIRCVAFTGCHFRAQYTLNICSVILYHILLVILELQVLFFLILDVIPTTSKHDTLT
jgi:hypothetical protein